MKYKRYTEKRNGKNVIPLRNAVCGVGLPKWSIEEHSEIQSFLSGDAVDRLAELEDKIENGTLKEINDKLIGEGVYGIHQDTTGKYWFDDDEHLLLGFTSDGIITWNDNHGYNDYFKDGLWFSTREETKKRLNELQGE